MIVAIRDHQRKSYGIREALRSCGWWVVPAGAPADLLLIDSDEDKADYRMMIDAYKDSGAKVVIYPHGGNAPIHWDGGDPYPVDACLTIGTGQRDVMRAYGYPHPIHVIGWSFCEQRSFRGGGKVERVLFAPQHPLGLGYLNPDLLAANQRAYKIVRGWGLPLTVRHVGSLKSNGLPREDDVRYEQAGLALSLGSIDMHDLVVARETFLSLAVARGIPALTFHQVQTNDPEGPDEPVVERPNREKYAELMRYPFDLADAYTGGRSASQGTTDPETGIPHLDSLAHASATEAVDWRKRFIGESLDPQALAEALVALCAHPRSHRTQHDSDAPLASEPARA